MIICHRLLLRCGVGPLSLLFAAFGFSLCAVASPVTPASLEISTTQQSIGLEWTLSGDTDHDAVCDVQYRVAGEANWRSAMSLIRVDSRVGNSLAGSILFLAPGTDYEVELSLTDPDGGADTQILNVRTKDARVAPTPTRSLHVVPGSSGGDGTVGNPYRGIATAWAQAQAGDELLLHAGSYGAVDDGNGQSGTAQAPIVFRDAGDGEVVLSHLQVFQHSNIWIEGVTFRFDGSSDTGFFASLLNAGYDNGFQSMVTDVDNITLINNRFEGFKHGVRAGPRTSGWYIADNTIIGDKQLGATGTPRLDGEGIELGHGSNHEVAYNSITLVADGISFPERNVDIYGNDIFDTTDDGIELDGGQANTRVWQNRIHNASNNGIGFQPQDGAPWYIIRNQIVNSQESIFKFRSGDRFVALHNTFINYDKVLDHHSHQLLRGITRNNLWVSVNNGPIWLRSDGGLSWQTDLDYDGFDWGTNSAPFEINGTKYSGLAELQAASGQLANGIEIDANACFESFNIPGPPPLNSVPAQYMTLSAACNAVDAGLAIPNVSDTFMGAAPDMGAYERGMSPPQYGPRTSQGPGTPVNRAPVANAGGDQAGDEGTSVSLSGAASSDADGDTLSYSWQQTSGPAVTFANSQAMATAVTLPEVSATTVLTIELTVTDSAGASAIDSLSVTVNDVSASPPPAPTPPAPTPPSGGGSGGGSGGTGATDFLWLLALYGFVSVRSRLRRQSLVRTRSQT